MYLRHVTQVFVADVIGLIDFIKTDALVEQGVAVISRKFQTERPFPSSLLSLVWDLSSGNGNALQGAAGHAVSVTVEAAEARAALWRDGWSQGAGQGRSLWFLGAALLAVQEISIAMAPCVPPLSCSGSPRGWSHRDRFDRAPATVFCLHSLLHTQQQPLCALLTIYPRVQSLLLSPSQMIV